MNTTRPPRPSLATAINVTEAIATNQHYYITGRPCAAGHIAWRKTNGRECMACRNSWAPGEWLITLDDLPPRLAVRLRTRRPAEDMLPDSPVANQVRKNMARARVRPILAAVKGPLTDMLMKPSDVRDGPDKDMIEHLDSFERALTRWLRRTGQLHLVPGIRRRSEALALDGVAPLVERPVIVDSPPAQLERSGPTPEQQAMAEQEMRVFGEAITPPDEPESPKQPASWSQLVIEL